VIGEWIAMDPTRIIDVLEALASLRAEPHPQISRCSYLRAVDPAVEGVADLTSSEAQYLARRIAAFDEPVYRAVVERAKRVTMLPVRAVLPLFFTELADESPTSRRLRSVIGHPDPQQPDAKWASA
jgi:hypothetical protein